MNPTPANNKNSGVTAQTITTRKKNNNFTSQCSAAATDDCSKRQKTTQTIIINRISAKYGRHNFGCGSFLLSGLRSLAAGLAYYTKDISTGEKKCYYLRLIA